MLRRDAGRGISVLQVRGLVDRDPRPGQLTPVIRQPRRRQGRQLRPQRRPVPDVGADQGLHPVPPLMPGRLRQAPAVRPPIRRQPFHVRERDLDAAALRQHAAQHHLDLGIYPRGASRDILYPDRSGRVVTVYCHKSDNASRPPPSYARGQFPAPPQGRPRIGHSPSHPPEPDRAGTLATGHVMDSRQHST
jgi:hypothetical protein